MKLSRFIYITLAVLVSLAFIMPLAGCALLGIGESEEFFGAVSSTDPRDTREANGVGKAIGRPG